MKSLLFRPRTGFPCLSSTTTSTGTRRTFKRSTRPESATPEAFLSLPEFACPCDGAAANSVTQATIPIRTLSRFLIGHLQWFCCLVRPSRVTVSLGGLTVSTDCPHSTPDWLERSEPPSPMLVMNERECQRARSALHVLPERIRQLRAVFVQDAARRPLYLFNQP